MQKQDTIAADSILASAHRTFDTEIAGLAALRQRLAAPFTEAVNMLLSCSGRVVVSGIGKSGHIAKKMAATFASTGTPSFFMHAAEAIHGDLGMLTADDIVLAISYSGSAHELLTIVPVAKRLDARVIAITGNEQSPLALAADLHLDAHIDHEACPLNLAPTASTTATLVLGDALAVACLESRGFSREDFARSHPGGALGRQLLTFVRDVMRHGDALPLVTEDTLVTDALAVMSAKNMGMTIVISPERKPIGIFTDGDLRRLISRHGDIRRLTVSSGMSRHPKTITAGALAVEAATQMDEGRLSQMLVVDADGLLLGALHMHDLLSAKVI